jgi:hypothetical protein
MRANKIEGPVPGSRAARALEAQRDRADDRTDDEDDRD